MMKKRSFLLRIILSVWLIILLVQVCCNLPALRQPEQFLSTVQATQPIPVDQIIIQQSNEQEWLAWVKQLSGELPVTINGNQTYLHSRYSYAMFLDYPEAQVMPYLLEQVLQWVEPDQIEIDPYTYTDAEQSYTWQNLIVRIPGKTTPQEKILLTAHMDSIVVREGDALQLAPGADDNATGTAVLLKTLRLLSDQSFQKTIEIIFFSGEEEGMQGSTAYLQDHDHEPIQAVINVDMIGYDSNNDGCVEIHAGTDAESQQIGLLLQQTMATYQLGLQPELLTSDATNRSDHGSFWLQQIPAITVMENFFETSTPGPCSVVDPNLYYHRNQDTVANINIPYAHHISQAVMLSIAQLAIPIE